MQINKYFAGEDFQGFWFGVVESRQDPLELGRIQVRMFATHSPSLIDIPSQNLPWALTRQDMNGKQFSTPKESELVFGIWLDNYKQIPLCFGVVPGIETNPPNVGTGFHDLRSESVIVLAPKILVGRTYNTDGSGITLIEANTADPAVIESLRHPNVNELNQSSISGVGSYQNLANTVIAARKNNIDNNILSANNFVWSEPYPAYNPEYPYDVATVTESGHVIEYDDTPGSERIHIAHRSGSFSEWYPSGSKVEKITRSNYRIVMADDYLHVMGKVVISVGGDALVRCNGDVILEAGGNLSANIAANVNYSVGGSFNINAGKNVNIQAADDFTVVSDTQHLTPETSLDISTATINETSSGDINLNAGGNFNAESGENLNLLGTIQSCLTGTTVGISGATQIGELISINDGAPVASPAGTAASGQASGIPTAISPLTKNIGVAPPEEVPIPLNVNVVDLDPITGSAYVQRLFLVPGANNTVANNNLVAPDANTTNTANCQYDITTKTTLGDPSTWAISQNGLNLIETAEGFAQVVAPDTAQAYPDPATGAQPLTIGYGTTQAALGQPITAGMTISRTTALDYLGTCVENAFLPVLQKNITVPITQNMLDAMLSLCYNIGGNNFLKSSVLSNLNQQNYCAAGNSFLLWNKAAGQVLPGLTTRRTNERTLFLT